MKIIIDDKIPFIKGVLEPFAEVKYLKGSEIDNSDLLDADALLIRTRTNVNSELLRDTRVKFIGSATIGTDHIDTSWCRDNNINVASAPGCNSVSVMQYIGASLAFLKNKFNTSNPDQTIGVIGVGNVGSKVASMARALGYNVLLNDPPRQKKEGDRNFCDINLLLAESDIITLHVPLTGEGKHPTFNMVDKIFLEKCRRGAIIINTSRGPVINENDLIGKIKDQDIKASVIDVWNNEPELNKDLLKLADIATPHIAGYSVDGKANGTTTIVNKLAYYFNLPLTGWKPEKLPQVSAGTIKTNSAEEAILRTYPIESDSQLLKESPEKFEELRGNYRIRREFGSYKVKTKNKDLIETLKDIGFNI